MTSNYPVWLLISGVLLLVSSAAYTICSTAVLSGFIVQSGVAGFNNAHLNIPNYPSILLSIIGVSLIAVSLYLAIKNPSNH